MLPTPNPASEQPDGQYKATIVSRAFSLFAQLACLYLGEPVVFFPTGAMPYLIEVISNRC